VPEDDEVVVEVAVVDVEDEDEDAVEVVVPSSLHPASRAKDEAVETMARARANRACIRNLFELE
jgi:hypothetical protein